MTTNLIFFCEQKNIFAHLSSVLVTVCHSGLPVYAVC